MFNIYCVTNKVNGKRYVGQTVDAVALRWKEHISAAKRERGCPLFGRAIRKYGVAAFTHELVEIVTTNQKDADAAEINWIERLQSLKPIGYNLMAGGGSNGRHHEDSKRLIGEASKKQWLEMTPEQQAKKVKNLQTPNRLIRVREANSTKEFSEKVRAGQKKFWEQFTPEEKTRRVRHQMAGMSAEQKSERMRKSWANATPEARAERIRNQTVGIIAAKSNNPEHSRKMSEWQTARQKTIAPEQRRAVVLKAWETRRAKYGQDGVKRVKTSEEYSESTARGWAAMSPEARVERGRKMSEGRQKAKAERTSRLIRINLLRAA